MKAKLKKFLPLIIILAILAGVYIVGYVFFTNHFWPMTTINGASVGNQTTEQIRKHGDLLAETGVFKVWNNSEEEDINLSDMGYTLTYDDSLEDLLESQDPWMWPYGLFEEQRLTCDTTIDVDDAALLNAVKNLSFVKEGNPAVDAKLEKQGNDIVIVPSEMGTKLDPSRLEAAIKKALFAGEFSVDGSQYVERPKLTEDNEGLLFQRDRFNEYKNASLRVDMTGAEEVITGDMFADWLMTDGTSIGWDREKVGAYVQQCAEKYNTYGSVRNFNATGIGVIQVGGSRGDSFGFKMSQDATADRILAAAENKEETVQAAWKIPGRWRGDNDFGNTYIEADISRQHVWYYQNGACVWESDCVSGLEGTGRQTPSGAFRVWSKQRNRVLRGPDYESPVSYWMPFDWTGCGLHDAPWRGAFGGKIYRSNGSHGCLNLPTSKAASLYNMVSIDTPVIVYRS